MVINWWEVQEHLEASNSCLIYCSVCLLHVACYNYTMLKKCKSCKAAGVGMYERSLQRDKILHSMRLRAILNCVKVII